MTLPEHKCWSNMSESEQLSVLQQWVHTVAVAWGKSHRANSQCCVAGPRPGGGLDYCWQSLSPAKPDGLAGSCRHEETLGICAIWSYHCVLP